MLAHRPACAAFLPHGYQYPERVLCLVAVPPIFRTAYLIEVLGTLVVLRSRIRVGQSGCRFERSAFLLQPLG
jgi:hypothetical protein